MVERTEHRIGHKTAKRAQRSRLHRITKVAQKREVCVYVLPTDDLVDGLRPTYRADAAGRALPTGFDGAEFHCEPGLMGHIDGIVEHHDAAVAQEAVARREGLIIEWCIE